MRPKSLTILQLFMILVLTLLPITFGSPQFKPGLNWAVQGSYQLKVGDMWDPDTYSESGHDVENYTVIDASSTQLHVTRVDTTLWSCVATGSWKPTCKISGLQNSTGVDDWRLSVPDMKVIASTKDQKYVGHSAWFMLDLRGLEEGGKIKRLWWTPTDDHTSTTPTDVDWKVTTVNVTVNSAPVVAWVISHTGIDIGYFYNEDKAYSVGPETVTYVFDPTYGTLIGGSMAQNATNTKGGWREVYSATWTLANSAFQIIQLSSVVMMADILRRGQVNF